MGEMENITIVSSVVPIPRGDGTSFTALRGEVVAVPSAVADVLIDEGHAVEGEALPPVTAPLELDQTGTTPEETQPPSDFEVARAGDGPAVNTDLGDVADVADPAAAAVDADATGEHEDEGTDESAPQVPKPAKTAPVAVWREFAIAQGLNPEEANETNRADLIALYG